MNLLWIKFQFPGDFHEGCWARPIKEIVHRTVLPGTCAQVRMGRLQSAFINIRPNLRGQVFHDLITKGVHRGI